MLNGILQINQDINQNQINSYRERLAGLLRQNSVFKGEFILASGQKSNYYLDTRLTTLSSEGVTLSSFIIFALIQPIIKEIHGIAGPSIGADPLVTGVSQLSFLLGSPLKAAYIRKEQKQYGRGKLVEGPINKGDNIIVLEDVITTGTSSLKAVNAIRSMGCEVNHLICLVQREKIGKELLEKEGNLKVHSVFLAEDLV